MFEFVLKNMKQTWKTKILTPTSFDCMCYTAFKTKQCWFEFFCTCDTPCKNDCGSSESLPSSLYSMIHPVTLMSSHSCRSLSDSDPAGWRKETAWRGLSLPAGQGPWSSCLSHCQVKKTNSGQKHDILGCELACEWQSLPLMEGKKCKSSPVTSKTRWTRFCTGLRS